MMNGMVSGVIGNSKDLSEYLDNLNKSNFFDYMTLNNDGLDAFSNKYLKNAAILNGLGIDIKIDYETESVTMKFLSDDKIEKKIETCNLRYN